MIDNRQAQLLSFVKSIILDDEIMLLPLNGDASFRRYFRVKGKNLIAVDSPPATQKNQEFIAIDEALAKVFIKVPKVVAYNLDDGFMLLEDLGELTFANVAVGEKREHYYLEAIKLLPKIASIQDLNLPIFDEKFISFELSLFETWMLEKRLNIKLDERERAILDKTYAYLIQNCLSQTQVFMHRDFHSRNLMLCGDKLAVIDFQDMVKGPLCYDLASIVYDCYVQLDSKLIDKLLKQAYLQYQQSGFLKDISFEQFKVQTTLTSLQRHIKVLGIFCRLSIRDHKDGYLKDLPTVIDYVLKECSNDPNLQEFKGIIEKYVVGQF